MKFDFLLSEDVGEKWGRSKGASSEEIETLKKCCGVDLPTDYIDFLTFSNGASAEIPVQPYYCILNNVKEVIEFIKFADYDVFVENLPGFIYIGTNGAGEFIVLELKSSRVCCVIIPFTEEEILEIAPTFIDLLKLFGHSEDDPSPET